MYGCKRWTKKKAECQRIDAFKSWCLEKTLERVLWAGMSSNLSVLKKINPRYS